MSKEKIVPFLPKDGQPPVTLRKLNILACKHESVEVDRDERRVYCASCGVELDPIAVLIDQAVRSQKIDLRIERLAELESARRVVDEEKQSRSVRLAKNKMRIVQGNDELQPGEYLLAASIKCHETGKEVSILVATSRPRQSGGEWQAIVELAAPRLFTCGGWSLVVHPDWRSQ